MLDFARQKLAPRLQSDDNDPRIFLSDDRLHNLYAKYSVGSDVVPKNAMDQEVLKTLLDTHIATHPQDKDSFVLQKYTKVRCKANQSHAPLGADPTTYITFVHSQKHAVNQETSTHVPNWDLFSNTTATPAELTPILLLWATVTQLKLQGVGGMDAHQAATTAMAAVSVLVQQLASRADTPYKIEQEAYSQEFFFAYQVRLFVHGPPSFRAQCITTVECACATYPGRHDASPVEEIRSQRCGLRCNVPDEQGRHTARCV